jgi:hypothetical protein
MGSAVGHANTVTPGDEPVGQALPGLGSGMPIGRPVGDARVLRFPARATDMASER